MTEKNMPDQKTIELILNNKKKLRCCLDEVIEPAAAGAAVRVDIRAEQEMNGIRKPLDSADMQKLTDLFDVAHNALMDIQNLLD